MIIILRGLNYYYHVIHQEIMHSCFKQVPHAISIMLISVNKSSWTSILIIGQFTPDETDRYQYGYVFTLIKCCATKLSILPEVH